MYKKKVQVNFLLDVDAFFYEIKDTHTDQLCTFDLGCFYQVGLGTSIENTILFLLKSDCGDRKEKFGVKTLSENPDTNLRQALLLKASPATKPSNILLCSWFFMICSGIPFRFYAG